MTIDAYKKLVCNKERDQDAKTMACNAFHGRARGFCGASPIPGDQGLCRAEQDGDQHPIEEYQGEHCHTQTARAESADPTAAKRQREASRPSYPLRVLP